MNRDERCKLIIKLYNECLHNGKYQGIVNELKIEIKAKRKIKLYGNKKQKVIFSTKTLKYKGIDVYIIMYEMYGIMFIFNTSPIDAPFVEYAQITPQKIPIIFTEHLLKRYNERACNYEYPNFKSIIIGLYVNNDIGTFVTTNPLTGEVVQRIHGGFLLGTKNEGYFVFNTFYDNEEYKDTEIKDMARSTKDILDNLNKQQIAELDKLYLQFFNGEIDEETYRRMLHIIGLG